MPPWAKLRIYLKASFRTEQEAVDFEPQLRTLLDDLVAFNNDWQHICVDTKRSSTERLAELRERHPLASELLVEHACVHPPDLPMNCLSVPLPDLSSD